MDLILVDEYLSRFYSGTPEKFFREYDAAIEAMLKMPEMYAVYPGTKDFRRFIVRDFLVFYKLDKANNLVSIYRILHGSQDIFERISRQMQ